MRSISDAVAVLALPFALTLAACRSQDKDVARSDSVDSADSAAGAATTSAAGPNVVTVRAKDYAFDAPKEIPAGLTTFRLVNDGPGFHHMQIMRLDSGKTFADFQQALKRKGPPPRWVVPVGGPNAPSPKLEAVATADMKPGNYALICFVDVPEHVPHFTKGMIQPLTVTAASGAAAKAPDADVKVTLRDYAFDFSTPLTAGRHTLEIRTDAQQPHEIEIIRLAPGKTADDMLGWLQKPSGPPPGEGLGGVAALVPGEPAYFTADFTPGDYMLICFVSDEKDGKPHFMHGMVRTVKVT